MPVLLETRDLVLPPRGAAPKTGADDPVEYYYRPLTAGLYRGRLRLASRLLEPGAFESVVEVGYGSGVFLPELARHSERLTGIEVHDEAAPVGAMLTRFGVEAELVHCSLFDMPFPDGSFDGLVSLSVLEHLTDLGAALDEFRRVLREEGIAVVGFPIRSPLTDAFFRLAGYEPRELHPSGHGDILTAVREHPGFVLEREGRLPWFLPLPAAAYAACRCRAV